MKQVYIENVYGYLIPVNCVRASERRGSENLYHARVMKTGHGYYMGEVVTMHRTRFVTKAGTNGYRELLRPYRVGGESCSPA